MKPAIITQNDANSESLPSRLYLLHNQLTQLFASLGDSLVPATANTAQASNPDESAPAASKTDHSQLVETASAAALAQDLH